MGSKTKRQHKFADIPPMGNEFLVCLINRVTQSTGQIPKQAMRDGMRVRGGWHGDYCTGNAGSRSFRRSMEKLQKAQAKRNKHG